VSAPAAAVAVALRDGSTVSLRPVRPDDVGRLERFLRGLDPEAARLRFFSAGADLRRAAETFAAPDPRVRGLVAVLGEDDRIVGHAEYAREGPRPSAEVAFEVAGELQGMGLATILLGHLAAHAAAHGISEFTAEVLPENHRMIGVFRDSGFPVEVRSEPGQLSVTFPTELGEDGRRRFERRDRLAAAAAVRSVLAPSSVVVVGASADRRTVGGALLHNLLAAPFAGTLYAVNRRADSAQGVRTYPSVADLPGPVELAVVAVPADDVVDVARESAAKGARALVVASAGFGEADGVGAARRAELVDVCRRTGMRLVGPNCLGVVNTAEEVRLHATFARSLPAPGRVGFLTQSGGLGIAVLDRLGHWDVGLSSFVSVGDKADLSGNDLLQFWEDDEPTGVVVLYLQSFGNPRRFGQIARRVARRKPVVAVKAGPAAAGQPNPASTTGALLAVADVRVDALFAQAGVIRTDTLAELLGVTALLAAQPLPAGPRTAIVTNAAGAGVVCADACAAAGLRVPEGYPHDVRAGAGATEYGGAVRAALADKAADAVIAVFVEPLAVDPGDVAAELRSACAARTREIPLLSVFLSGDPSGAPAPVFGFPEDAARALGRAAAYSAWRQIPEGVVPGVAARADEAAAVVASALSREDPDGWLREGEVEQLLACHGIPRLPVVRAATPEHAGEAAAAIAGPVCVKGVAPGLAARTDAGAVELGLHGAAAAAAAATAIARRLGESGHRGIEFTVQPMAPAGVELLVGVAHDPRLGPVVACGAGGPAAGVLRDVAVRLAPLTDTDAAAMLRGLAIFPLLEGRASTPRADLESVTGLLARVSSMVEAHPEIAEMDLEPVVAAPEGAFVIGARVRVEARSRPRDVPAVR
jgi:acyl-CoA synthetase (NDP forming)/RimJ/RimL family protein N-acetyltransferase